VSVVEIIKREYLKSLELKHSTRLTGLYQYNELSCLEDLEPEDNRMEEDTPQATNEEARVQNIVQALGGKNQYVTLVSLRSGNSFRCSSSPLTQCEAETNSFYAHYPFNAISASVKGKGCNVSTSPDQEIVKICESTGEETGEKSFGSDESREGWVKPYFGSLKK
jgi:hypothetical protein